MYLAGVSAGAPPRRKAGSGLGRGDGKGSWFLVALTGVTIAVRVKMILSAMGPGLRRGGEFTLLDLPLKTAMLGQTLPAKLLLGLGRQRQKAGR